MEEFLNSIDTFLSQQPWWIIALGSAVLVLIIKSKLKVSVDAKLVPGRTFKEQVQATVKPISVDTTSAEFVKITSNQNTFDTNTNTQNIVFDGAEATQLHDFLRKGDKINAIKLIREKKNLDLVTAKNIVEAMSKFS